MFSSVILSPHCLLIPFRDHIAHILIMKLLCYAYPWNNSGFQNELLCETLWSIPICFWRPYRSLGWVLNFIYLCGLEITFLSKLIGIRNGIFSQIPLPAPHRRNMVDTGMLPQHHPFLQQCYQPAHWFLYTLYKCKDLFFYYDFCIPINFH